MVDDTGGKGKGMDTDVVGRESEDTEDGAIETIVDSLGSWGDRRVG